MAGDGQAGDALQARASQQIQQMIGLARRAGLVLLGAGALAREPLGRGGVVFAACDAAARTQRGLPDVAVPVPLTSEELGRAAGQKPVAALGMRAGRHALQAAYWQRVWYEGARDDSSRGSGKGQHTEVAG